MKIIYSIVFLLSLQITLLSQFPATIVDCESRYQSIDGNVQYMLFDWCGLYTYNVELDLYEEEQVPGNYEFYLKMNCPDVSFKLNGVCFICNCIEDPIHIKSYECVNKESEVINFVYLNERNFLFRKNVYKGVYSHMYNFIK